jgi:anti-anti-sigma regulatory factor
VQPELTALKSFENFLPSDLYRDPEVQLSFQAYVAWSEENIDWASAKMTSLYSACPGFKPLIAAMSADKMQKANLESLAKLRLAAFESNWEPYLTGLWARGDAYARMGIQLTDWTDVFQRSRWATIEKVFEQFPSDALKLKRVLAGMNCMYDTLLQLVGQSFFATLTKLAAEQASAIQELSTPLLAIAEGVLLLPLIGELDERRMTQVQTRLLASIRQTRARVVVIDVTGMGKLSGHAGQQLERSALAARLVGAQVIISGLSREACVTMVSHGVQLSGIATYSTLQDALLHVSPKA